MRIVKMFLRVKYGTSRPKALFIREARELFQEFKKWHQDKFYTPAKGVRLVDMVKILRKEGIPVVYPKRKEGSIFYK